MFNVWGPARLLSQRPRHFTCTTVCDGSSFCILTTPVIVCLWWQPSSWVWSGVSLWFGFACPSWLCVYTRYTSVLERKRTVQIVQPDPFIFQIKNLRFRKRGWKGAVPRGKLPASVFSGLNNKLHCLLISVIFKNITSHLFFKLHYLLNLFFPDIDIFLIVKTLIAKPRCHFFHGIPVLLEEWLTNRLFRLEHLASIFSIKQECQSQENNWQCLLSMMKFELSDENLNFGKFVSVGTSSSRCHSLSCWDRGWDEWMGAFNACDELSPHWKICIIHDQ